MKDVRVAAAQFFAQPCKPNENLNRIEYWVKKAKKYRVEMICFPEMSISGFDYRQKLRPIYNYSESVPNGSSTQRIIKMAKNSGMVILAGISEKGEGELRYNTCVIASPEGYIGKYRKVHMNSERWLYCESSIFPVFDTSFGRIGVSICFDNTFSECARILAICGVEILFAPHCYGKIDKSKIKKQSSLLQVKRWREREPMKFMQARANDNNMFVIFSNMVGGPHHYIGGSFILDPYGNLIASVNSWKEGMAIADLKASVLVEARAKQTCSLKRRRPFIYSDIVRVT
jgi:predicted amidohydrolase